MSSDPSQQYLYPNDEAGPPYEEDPVLERFDQVTLLALADVPGIGFNTIRGLYDVSGGHLHNIWEWSVEAFVEQLRRYRLHEPEKTVKSILKNMTPSLEKASYFLDTLHRQRITLILENSFEYPRRLRDLSDRPRWLFVEGDCQLLNAPRISAVIGTRNPTRSGKDVARKVSAILMQQGCMILSGLAEGIDENSHRTAVDFGIPTIAILGHGLRVIFPAKTAGLRREIVETGGCVVSEYLLNDSFAREKFVQRNRIQSALSGLIVVVEGRSKSGTSHTVRFANELQHSVIGAASSPELFQTENGELLVDLARRGAPVFVMSVPEEVVQFRGAIEYIFRDLPRSFDPDLLRLFARVRDEIARVADDYDPTSQDFAWLKKEIEKIRKNRK